MSFQHCIILGILLYNIILNNIFVSSSVQCSSIVLPIDSFGVPQHSAVQHSSYKTLKSQSEPKSSSFQLSFDAFFNRNVDILLLLLKAMCDTYQGLESEFWILKTFLLIFFLPCSIPRLQMSECIKNEEEDNLRLLFWLLGHNNGEERKGKERKGEERL